MVGYMFLHEDFFTWHDKRIPIHEASVYCNLRLPYTFLGKQSEVRRELTSKRELQGEDVSCGHPTKRAYTGSQINSPGISPGTSKLFPLDPVTIQERGEKWRRVVIQDKTLLAAVDI